jgi:hypothetical protein
MSVKIKEEGNQVQTNDEQRLSPELKLACLRLIMSNDSQNASAFITAKNLKQTPNLAHAGVKKPKVMPIIKPRSIRHGDVFQCNSSIVMIKDILYHDKRYKAHVVQKGFTLDDVTNDNDVNLTFEGMWEKIGCRYVWKKL